MITFLIQTDMFSHSILSYYNPFEKRTVEEVFLGDEKTKEVQVLRKLIIEGANQLATQRKNNFKHSATSMAYNDRLYIIEKLNKLLSELPSTQYPFFFDKATTAIIHLKAIQPPTTSIFFKGYTDRLTALESLIEQLKTLHRSIND